MYYLFIFAVAVMALGMLGLTLLRGRDHFMEPINFFLLAFMVPYVVQPIQGAAFFQRAFPDSVRNTAMLSALLAIATFIFFYRHAERAKSPRIGRLAQTEWVPGSLRTFGLVLVGMGVLGQALFVGRSGGFETYYSAARGAGDYLHNTAYLYGAKWFVLTGITFILVDYDGKPRGQRAYLVLGIVLAAFYYLYQIYIGQRSGVIALSLLYLMLYRVKGGRKPTLKLYAAAFFIVAFIVGFLGKFRSEIYLGSSFEGVRKMELEDIPGLVIGSAGAAGSRTGIGSKSEFGMLLRAVDLVPSRVPFDYGMKFLNVFVIWIPRILWPDRPTFGASVTPQQLAYSMALYEAGPSLGFVGSFWVNGGILAILVAAALHGYVLGLVWTLYRKGSKRSLGLLIFLLFFDMGWEWALATNGMYLTLIARGPWRLLPIIIVAVFLSRRAPVRAVAPATAAAAGPVRRGALGQIR